MAEPLPKGFKRWLTPWHLEVRGIGRWQWVRMWEHRNVPATAAAYVVQGPHIEAADSGSSEPVGAS